MSSFICSAKHFNSIEKALNNYFSGSKSSEYSYSFYKYLGGNATGDQIREKIKNFIDTLRELNVMCVSLQYKHHSEGTLDTEISEQRERVYSDNSYKTIDIYGLIKALACVNYQLETENLIEFRPLTESETTALKYLDDLKYDLCYYLVNTSPQYDKGDWEIM